MKYFLTMNLFGIHWSETLGTCEGDFRPMISNFRTLKKSPKSCVKMHICTWESLKPWLSRTRVQPYDFNPHPRDSDTHSGPRHQHQPACAEHSTISTDWVSTKDRTRHHRTPCLPSPPKAQIGAHLRGLSVLDSCLFKCTNHCHESQ